MPDARLVFLGKPKDGGRLSCMGMAPMPGDRSCGVILTTGDVLSGGVEQGGANTNPTLHILHGLDHSQVVLVQDRLDILRWRGRYLLLK